MTTVKHPNGATCVSPYLTVVDVKKAAEFYQNAFNCKIKELPQGPDGEVCHGELQYEDQLIMLGKENSYGFERLAPVTSNVDCPISLYLYCENVDQFYQQALAQGAVSLIEPENMFWGDRMCALKCPNGYHWSFATHLEK